MGDDPMVRHKIGGVNVFGGGLALYDETGRLLGGIGVSGDSSCADHNIVWKVRHGLNLDNVPAGVSPTKDDNIVYDITNGASAGVRRIPSVRASNCRCSAGFQPASDNINAGIAGGHDARGTFF